MTAPAVIKTWHIPIFGFRQTIGQPTGIDKLWSSLRVFSTTSVSVFPPLKWNTDFENISEFIHNHWFPGTDRPEILVYAYSWGCGHGATSLAKGLKRRGLLIDSMVLCDPVYYKWGQWWRALICSPSITIPQNVVEVHSFFQRLNKPQGTSLYAENEERTTIHVAKQLYRSHAYMDEAPEFHSKCLEIAEKFSGR